jgi:hypothetical protein
MNHDAPEQSLVVDMCESTFHGRRQTTVTFKLVVALWLAIVVGGALLLQLHATTPGQQDDTPARWPLSSRITHNSSGATLLVFVHPYCPCARATLGELDAIMTACRDKLTAYVIFVVASDENPDWAQNELGQTASVIPGVRAVVDSQAVEAKRFGAQTSGVALFFDEQGMYVFAGGITESRGHAGDNMRPQAIVSSLANRRSKTRRAPTFGCALFAEGSAAISREAL